MARQQRPKRLTLLQKLVWGVAITWTVIWWTGMTAQWSLHAESGASEHVTRSYHSTDVEYYPASTLADAEHSTLAAFVQQAWAAVGGLATFDRLTCTAPPWSIIRSPYSSNKDEPGLGARPDATTATRASLLAPLLHAPPRELVTCAELRPLFNATPPPPSSHPGGAAFTLGPGLVPARGAWLEHVGSGYFRDVYLWRRAVGQGPAGVAGQPPLVELLAVKVPRLLPGTRCPLLPPERLGSTSGGGSSEHGWWQQQLLLRKKAKKSIMGGAVAQSHCGRALERHATEALVLTRPALRSSPLIVGDRGGCGAVLVAEFLPLGTLETALAGGSWPAVASEGGREPGEESYAAVLAHILGGSSSESGVGSIGGSSGSVGDLPRLPSGVVAAWALGAAAGLAALHGEGVAHADVRADQFLLRALLPKDVMPEAIPEADRRSGGSTGSETVVRHGHSGVGSGDARGGGSAWLGNELGSGLRAADWRRMAAAGGGLGVALNDLNRCRILKRRASPVVSLASRARAAIAGRRLHLPQEGLTSGDQARTMEEAGPGEEGLCAFTVAVARGKWRAPEELRGEPQGLPADVYSLGLVLWSLLGRRKPFARLGKSQARLAALAGARPPLPAAWCRDDGGDDVGGGSGGGNAISNVRGMLGSGGDIAPVNRSAGLGGFPTSVGAAPPTGVRGEVCALVKECWAADPAARPTAATVRDRLAAALARAGLQGAGGSSSSLTGRKGVWARVGGGRV